MNIILQWIFFLHDLLPRIFLYRNLSINQVTKCVHTHFNSFNKHDITTWILLNNFEIGSFPFNSLRGRLGRWLLIGRSDVWLQIEGRGIDINVHKFNNISILLYHLWTCIKNVCILYVLYIDLVHVENYWTTRGCTKFEVVFSAQSDKRSKNRKSEFRGI